MTESLQNSIPKESYFKLFMRFIRFGLLAWGGPVAQIAMIRQELVETEKWISPDRFNRVFAVYQVLPGPEAHELCVYFGLLSGGRVGALLAGLGFMLPGFLFMFALSWLYVSFGITSPLFQSIFLGMQPAVGALIVTAVQRIGSHALHNNRWLWGIALLAGFAQLGGMNFIITLLIAGIIYALYKRGNSRMAQGLGVAAFILVGFYAWSFSSNPISPSVSPTSEVILGAPSLLTLLLSGLRSGLLTFGGAYTVIPFLQHDAVEIGRWMTNAQFLDGLALSGLLPAPLIIFSTFVGYIGGGPLGALAMTVGIFLPAFAFTMIGHDYLERLVENQSAHAFLDGVTAGVVGLIAVTALTILNGSIVGMSAWVIFGLSLIGLYRLKAKWTVAAVVLSAGILGFFLNL